VNAPRLTTARHRPEEDWGARSFPRHAYSRRRSFTSGLSPKLRRAPRIVRAESQKRSCRHPRRIPPKAPHWPPENQVANIAARPLSLPRSLAPSANIIRSAKSPIPPASKNPFERSASTLAPRQHVCLASTRNCVARAHSGPANVTRPFR